MNRTKLLRDIRDDFRDVKLEDGVSLNMTEDETGRIGEAL